MTLDRRSFATFLATAAVGRTVGRGRAGMPALSALSALGGLGGLGGLSPMLDDVKPISDEERRARMAKAQRLMGQAGISALLLEPGTSMTYFTGMGWSLSERPFVAILPAKGDLTFVCPGFEEARARERIKFTGDVRVWQEDESPYKVIATVLADHGVRTGKLGVEERVRFFIADGLKNAAPALTLVSGDPISAGCRMYKSPAELALMQR
ncbi:MAG TPA: aminopeptidase P family N-terminal domain-containing protein, partial [Gemmatimonadales bacterium]|nr:aminopeptidase P family N-terminal domain-containing protein [Gemmatimonadales bacterium]